jgi:hypothetical protein
MRVPAVRNNARGVLLFTALPFVLAIGVVAGPSVPQPFAVSLCVVVGWAFAFWRGRPEGKQVALLGTLAVFLSGTVKAWWLDDGDSAVGLLVPILVGIAFLALTAATAGRMKE